MASFAGLSFGKSGAAEAAPSPTVVYRRRRTEPALVSSPEQKAARRRNGAVRAPSPEAHPRRRNGAARAPSPEAHPRPSGDVAAQAHPRPRGDVAAREPTCRVDYQRRLRHRVVVAAMGAPDDGDDAASRLREIGRVELSVEPTASCDALRTRVAELLGVPVASFWLTLDKRLLEGSWCLGTFGILRSGAVVRLLPRAAELFTPALFAAPDVRALCAAVARDAVEAALREADDRAAEAAAAELRAAMADVVDASLPRRASTASRATAGRRTRGLGWTGGTRLLASERH